MLGSDSRTDRRGGAKPGDVVAIDLIELTSMGVGKSAILREFGVLRRELPGRARAHHSAEGQSARLSLRVERFVSWASRNS
jgi:acetamidase/formamidase